MYAASDGAKKATIYQERTLMPIPQKKLTVRTTELFRLMPPPEFGQWQFRRISPTCRKTRPGASGEGYCHHVDRKAPYVPSLKEIEPEVEAVS
jgi:hypothetical protein